MTGSYNLLTSIADMKIYGSLTKNITTVFGKIKNASLNTLFNTIPGINDATENCYYKKILGKFQTSKMLQTSTEYLPLTSTVTSTAQIT